VKVYFIQAGDGGPIKIGTAVDVAQRTAELQTGNHQRLIVLATLDGGRQHERALHRRFAEHRIAGEWFHAHGDIINLIRDVEAGAVLDEHVLPRTAEPGDVASMIAALGGLTAVAREFQTRPSTIQGWVKANFIPRWRQPALLAVAARKGVAITANDFPQKFRVC
jgi:hypothetical protein